MRVIFVINLCVSLTLTLELGITFLISALVKATGDFGVFAKQGFISCGTSYFIKNTKLFILMLGFE